MTKDIIEKRIAELQAEFLKAKALYEQTRANVDALAGAIQDCQFWLTELTEKKD